MWIRITGDINYISPRYIFILSLVLLKKYAKKRNNLMWMHMVG